MNTYPLTKETKLLELKDTVDGMLSTEYKERFVAEYVQTVIRLKKLCNLLSDHENGRLNFELSCNVWTLHNQRALMASLVDVLEFRADVEGIELPLWGDFL